MLGQTVTVWPPACLTLRHQEVGMGGSTGSRILGSPPLPDEASFAPHVMMLETLYIAITPTIHPQVKGLKLRGVTYMSSFASTLKPVYTSTIYLPGLLATVLGALRFSAAAVWFGSIVVGDEVETWSSQQLLLLLLPFNRNRGHHRRG